MKLIEKDDFEGAKKVIEEAGHSGASYGITVSIIISFSKKGPAFYRFMEPELSEDPETKAYLEEVEKESLAFEEELGKGQSE